MPIKRGQKGMEQCMREWKQGTLHSGKDGPVVTSHKQAVAICRRVSNTFRGPKPRK